MLSVGYDRSRPTLSLSTVGLNRAVVEAWLDRTGVGHHEAGNTIASGGPPLVRLPTIVVSGDRRLDDVSRVYAAAVGAPVALANTPSSLRERARAIPGSRTLTLFMLHDALEERWLHALWKANRERQREGCSPLVFGVMTGLSPAQVGWLAVKTLAWLRPVPTRGRIDLVDFDGFTGCIRRRSLDSATGRVEESDGDASLWTSAAVQGAALFTHSVSFDAWLGELALCGQPDPALAEPPSVGPSCYFDGRCFRLERAVDSLRGVLKAVHATPLFWFLNGCGVLPLAGSAFGSETGYVHGLLAGAALGVVGPYVTQVTSVWRNTVFLGLLVTGATMGQAAEALSRLVPAEGGFDSYPLLGSPDLRLRPPALIRPVVARRETARYRVAGAGVWARRLALPARWRADATVVADDGGEAWHDAGGQLLARRRELLVLFQAPRDMDGWLELGRARGREDHAAAYAAEVQRRLEVLKLYAFTRPVHEALAGCAATATQLLLVLQADTLLRRRFYSAALEATLESQLEELHRLVACRFLDEVAVGDINLDRESYNGFLPGLVVRTARPCPACGGPLFSAFDRWQRDPGYRRRRDLCANCFTVSMVLESSPLAVSPPRLRTPGPGPSLTLELRLRNRTRHALRVWIAAAPRFAPPGTTVAPFAFHLGPRAAQIRTLDFAMPPLPLGTVSIRVIVLAAGSAEFHSFKLREWRPRGGGADAAPPGPAPST